VRTATIQIIHTGALRTAIGVQTISWAAFSLAQGPGSTAGTVVVGTTAGGTGATAIMAEAVIMAGLDTATVARDTGIGAATLVAGRDTAAIAQVTVIGAAVAAMLAAGSTAMLEAGTTVAEASTAAVVADSTVGEAGSTVGAAATAAATGNLNQVVK